MIAVISREPLSTVAGVSLCTGMQLPLDRYQNLMALNRRYSMASNTRLASDFSLQCYPQLYCPSPSHQEHISTAISLNPKEPTLHYLLGRWCSEVRESLGVQGEGGGLQTEHVKKVLNKGRRYSMASNTVLFKASRVSEFILMGQAWKAMN